MTLRSKYYKMTEGDEASVKLVEFPPNAGSLGTDVNGNIIAAGLAAVVVWGKCVNAGDTTTATPTSIIPGAHPNLLGSFSIPAGFTKVGTTYTLQIDFVNSVYDFYLDVSLSSVATGGGSLTNILIPAGSSRIEISVFFDDNTYGANSNIHYIIFGNTVPYINVYPGSGWGAFNPDDIMTFNAKIHTHTTAAASFNSYVKLWSE